MTICNGERAEEVAEAYIQGSLSEFETERFEDHYFDCQPCFARLQAVQSIQQELASRPAMESFARERWRHRMFILAAVAAALIVGVLVTQSLRLRHEQTTASLAMPSPAVTSSNGANTTPSAPSLPAVPSKPTIPSVTPPAVSESDSGDKQSSNELTELADLSLPPFSANTLRGGEVQDDFTVGMQAYTRGDCAAALPSLASVPAENQDATAAQFYSAACELDSHRLGAAIADFRKVIHVGDSPQLEAANYYLAQAMLERGDASAARSYLQRTVALHGDYEQLARDQLQRLKK
jgi:hypothetical protein